MERDQPAEIEDLQQRLRAFAEERDWEQFHNPKNLVMALAGEVGELTEIFQWLTLVESENAMGDPSTAARVREELADVFGYVLRLADVLGVQLPAVLEEKINENSKKYPIETSRGNAKKYTELGPIPSTGST